MVWQAIRVGKAQRDNDGHSQNANKAFMDELETLFGRVGDDGRRIVDWHRVHQASEFLFKQAGGCQEQREPKFSESEAESEQEEEAKDKTPAYSPEDNGAKEDSDDEENEAVPCQLFFSKKLLSDTPCKAIGRADSEDDEDSDDLQPILTQQDPTMKYTVPMSSQESVLGSAQESVPVSSQESLGSASSPIKRRTDYVDPAVPSLTSFLSPSKNSDGAGGGHWEQGTYVISADAASGLKTQRTVKLRLSMIPQMTGQPDGNEDAEAGETAPPDERGTSRRSLRRAGRCKPPSSSQEAWTSSQEMENCDGNQKEVERRRFLTGRPSIASKQGDTGSTPIVVSIPAPDAAFEKPKDRIIGIRGGDVKTFADEVKKVSTSRVKRVAQSEAEEAKEAAEEARRLGLETKEPTSKSAPNKAAGRSAGKGGATGAGAGVVGKRKRSDAGSSGSRYRLEEAEASEADEDEEVDDEPTVSDEDFVVSDGASISVGTPSEKASVSVGCTPSSGDAAGSSGGPIPRAKFRVRRPTMAPMSSDED